MARNCCRGAQAGGRRDGDAGVDAALQTCDANHEEFVEVVCEDRGEAGALDDRQILVLSKLEDSLVELQPAQLAVEEAVVRQRFFTGLQLRLSFLSVSAMCSANLAAQNRL